MWFVVSWFYYRFYDCVGCLFLFICFSVLFCLFGGCCIASYYCLLGFAFWRCFVVLLDFVLVVVDTAVCLIWVAGVWCGACPVVAAW